MGAGDHGPEEGGVLEDRGQHEAGLLHLHQHERLFFPLINEGFKILEEGFATRPSDIDICYIFGYGFPPAKGGPMFYAENYVGLKPLLEKLRAFDADAKERPKNGGKYRDYFAPSKLLELCVEKECSILEGVETLRSSSKL